MNNIVQNAIAARGVVNDAGALSGYNIYWIYIKPVGGGIVTEADKKKLYRGGRWSFISFPNEKEIKYEIPKDKYNDEVARLKGIKGLSKAMRVTYITDKQFGRKMGPTQKQMEGSFVIGNSGVADETVSNAIAAHRAKNDADGEKKVKVENALTSKQYKTITNSLYDAVSDSDACVASCKTVGLILRDIQRAIGDVRMKGDKEAANDSRAIEASLVACGRTLGTLTLAVATLRRNVVNMEDKYAGYDRKRLID